MPESEASPERSVRDTHVREGLQRYLADQVGAPVDITSLKRPTANGFSSDTFIVELSSNALPPNLVVQAAPLEAGLFDNYDIARSFRVQEGLAAFDVPVAQMRSLCEDDQWLGVPFYVMEHVKGQVPGERPCYHVEGWLFESDAETQAAVWRNGIEAMAALHRVDASNFAFLGDVEAVDWSGQRLDEWRHFGEDLGDDAESTLLDSLEVLRSTRPADSTRCVHWGDAKLGNMMFDDARAMAILDWELCGLSAREEDLAHWFAVDWFVSTVRGLDRLADLPGVAESVTWYESAAGGDTEGVDWWFAFALIRMGLIFQRAAVRADRADGRPVRPNVIAPFAQGLVDGSIWAELNDAR